MGKLVPISNEEQKTTAPAPIAAQGTKGKLIQTGTPVKMASSFTTTPAKTTPTVQPSKTATVPAKATSPMSRTQQTPDTRTPYQKALDEAMMKRAAADRRNRERGHRSSGRSHAQEVREITGDRTKTDVGSLVKSAAAGYAADMVGAADTLLRLPSGLNYAASQERGEIEASKKNIAAYTEKLKAAKTEEERQQWQTLIDRNKRLIEINSEYAGKKTENYRNLTKGAQDTLQRTYQNLRSSAAENMQKANEGQGAVGQLLNNVAVAGMQMGADIAAGLGRATVPMAARVFGGSSQEAMEEGIQPDMTDAERLDMQNRALLYGAGSAGVSVLSEKLSNVAAPFKKAFGSGVLDKAINRAVAKMGGNAAGKIAMSFASEGFEEMFEDAVQPILQSIYNGQSVGENYSELEISDMLYDGLVGGILGGLGGGVEVAANRFSGFDSTLGESGRKAIRGSYQEGTDASAHVEEFIPAYNAGKEGKPNPNTTSETAYAGYIAGQNDAKAEARKKTFAQESDGGSGLVYDDYVSREMDTATADEINTVAKALGVRVRMEDQVRGGTANGEIEGNEIRIAKDAQDPVMQVVGHEWTHRVQELAPEQYTAFRSAIMKDSDVAEAANILHERYNSMGVEISMDQAMDEAAANYAGEMIANTDVLSEFIRRHSEDRTMLQKLRDAIREIVGKLTGRAKKQAQTAEGLLQQAFEAAARNSKNAASEGGKARFEIKTLDDGRSYVKADRQVLDGDDPKKWGVQLQNYINSEIRKGNDIVLPTTDGQLVRLTERSAYKLADDKSTDLKTHKKTQLSDEAYRLKETAAAHIDEIILTGEFSHNMEDIGGTHENDIGEDGFNSYVAYFEDRDGQYYRISFVSALNGNEETAYSIGNIQKRKKPTTGNGSSSRERGALNGGRLSTDSISRSAENVKRYSLKEDSAGRELTEAQQEYFRGSKAVDEDGRLLTMYHQTDGVFTIFDPKREGAGTRDNGTPFGIFLKTSKRDIGLRGKNQMELYVNLKNPLQVQNRDELTSTLRKMSPEYDKILQEHKSLDTEYKKKNDDAMAALKDFMISWRAEHKGEDSRKLYDIPEFNELFDAEDTISEEWTSKADELSIRAKEVLTDALRNAGYDGVILQNDVGSFGRSTDAYIALDPEQVKNVSNKNPTSDPDIRHSLKGTENAQELAALKRENEALRERVDYWKGQTKRSDGVRTDSKSVAKTANELTKRYGAEIEGSEIAGDLAGLYDYIARGGDETGELTYTEARSRADSIAQRITESAIAKDDELYQTYSELRKFLKDTKITLSAEDAAGITDYADFRRGLFGKVNLGKGEKTNVDQVYSELAESYPEFFSETRENNVSDQLTRIADVAGELYNVSEYNPFEGYMGQAVSSISNDILDRFFDLPQAKKTFADVQAEKLDAANAAGRKAAAEAKLAGQMAQGRTDAVKLRHTKEALQKARAQQAEKLDALRNRYREKDTARREGQKKRELRAKITRHAKDLSKKLLRPTDKRHIPEGMRSSVASLLGSINQESAYTVDADGKRVYDGSGAPTKRTQAFRELQKQYREILADVAKDDKGKTVDSWDIVIDPSLVETGGLLDQVIKMGDRRLSELTGDELRTMWKTIRAVEHSVSTAGKVLSKSKFETTSQMADSFKNDLRTRRKKLGNNTTISLETPYTFFAHYGETGKSIYRMLRNAQDHQEVMARNVAEKVQQVLGDELGAAGAKEIAGEALRGNFKGSILYARSNAVGKWEAQTHHFTVPNGGELTLTTPQIMELYLLSKRKQALGHLLGGGVYQPEIKRAQTGEKTIERGTHPVFLTEGDIETITGKLTSEQKRVADGLQELTATTLANYGNEASMKAYGYRKFTERNYWPIKSSREGVHSNQEKDSGNARSIKNIGMAQQVQQNANNAVELHSAFDTFANHASDMIDYAAWLTTMEDLNRFYNFRYQNEAGKTFNTVKGLLDEKGGKGSQQYWQKLMGDIQNGISVKDFEPITGKVGKYVGKFKGAAVGANVRVVIQQPTAFFRASAVLDPGDMAKGLAGGVTKGNGWEKALKYSPTAMRKDVGSFDISSPYTLQERFYGKSGITDKINDLAGAAAGKADAVTWGKLWNACEWQVKRENPDLRAGSNEFYSAVNEVFTDMIDQTQVVDGILQRSNIMRGKSTLSQQATAFMGEPIMSLNVLMRSYDAFRYEENPAKRSKALKNVGRAATALVVTNVVNALAQSVVDGLRDDDRDKDYLEKLLSAFTGVEGDEKNAFELISNVALNGNVGSNMNPIAQIPFAKDVLSLAQGYDVSRPDMEVFSDMVNAAKTFIDSAGGDGKKTRKEATIGLLAAASKFFGLPVANIKRDLMATLRTAAQASGNLGFQYEVEKFSYNLNNSSNKSRFVSILYDALEQGDYATYEHVRRALMEQMQLDGESIQSSLKTAYNKKLKEDSGYTMPKKSLDMIGVRGKYAEDTPEEAKFSAKDLDASAYSKYESQRSDTYSAAENAATSSGAFSSLSGEGKDKALTYADTYAKETALAANSGGKYQIATKWVMNAQEAQSKYKITPGVFAACKAAASECESLKDADGKAIDLSKGLQIMEMLFRSGLNETQRTAMYEYLDVPKSIRHWNRARVDEQLKIARRKAA
jgi:hypothetical protein